jgi:hypothetical protein
VWCVEAANEVLPAELPLGGLYDVPKEVSWMKVLEIHWMTDRGCCEEDGIVLARHLTQSQKHMISKNRRLFPTYGTSCRGWFLNLKKELTKLKIRWCPSYNRGELMLRSYKQ